MGCAAAGGGLQLTRLVDNLLCTEQMSEGSKPMSNNSVFLFWGPLSGLADHVQVRSEGGSGGLGSSGLRAKPILPNGQE